MAKSLRNSRPVTLLRSVIRADHLLRGLDAAYTQEHFDLSTSECDVVFTLGNTDGMRMCELAAHMLTSPPNVTRVAKKLEEKGLLERVRGELSDREVVARLTVDGVLLFEHAYPLLVENLRVELNRRLSVAEQETLITLLEKLQP